MAGKAGKMRKWIEERNGGLGAEPSDYDDLKMPPPGPKQKEKKSKHSHRTNGEGRQSGHQSHRGAIEDTDGSEADKTSTVVSNGYHQQQQAAHQQPAAQQQYRQVGDAMYDHTDAQGQSFDGGEQDEFGDLNADPAVMAEFYERASRDAWLNEIQVKGDSYPATTSGRVSAVELDDRETIAPKADAKTTGTRHRNKTRTKDAPVTRLPLNPAHNHQSIADNRPEPLRPQKPVGFEPEEVTGDNGQTGFAFAAANLRNPDMRRMGHDATSKGHFVKQEQPNAQPSIGRPAAPNAFRGYPLQHPHAPATGKLEANNQSRQDLPARVMSKQPQPKPQSQPQLQPVQPHAVQAQLACPDPTGPALEGQPEEMPDAYDPDDRATAGQQDDHDPYDYSPSEIYSRSLESLAAEKFDNDPKASPFVVPGLTDAPTLADKIANAAALEPNGQSAFFASLDIDEWDEAGDWFLDRFADVVKKLKATRQEKRQAARVFEQEINGRNVAIGKKRAATDVLLGGMRLQGNAVLQATPGGTPKKRRSSQ